MFGSLGVQELLLIFALILIVFGPRRIPEIGRTLGKALGEFRKATDDLKSTIEREVRIEELKKITPTIVAPFESISRNEPLTESPTESSSLRVDEPASGTEEPPSSPDLSSTTRRLDDSATPNADSVTPNADSTTPSDSTTRKLDD